MLYKKSPKWKIWQSGTQGVRLEEQSFQISMVISCTVIPLVFTKMCPLPPPSSIFSPLLAGIIPDQFWPLRPSLPHPASVFSPLSDHRIIPDKFSEWMVAQLCLSIYFTTLKIEKYSPIYFLHYWPGSSQMSFDPDALATSSPVMLLVISNRGHSTNFKEGSQIKNGNSILYWQNFLWDWWNDFLFSGCLLSFSGNAVLSCYFSSPTEDIQHLS